MKKDYICDKPYGFVEYLVLSTIIGIFLFVFLLIYFEEQAVVEEDIDHINTCPAEYVAYYTEIGTKEFKPVFSCDNNEISNS